MKETILLEEKKKRLFIITGIFYFLGGVFYLYIYNALLIGQLFGVFTLAGGIFQIVYFFIGVSENSKYAAKVKITDKVIELKSSFWKAAELLNWSDIKSIQFVNYHVEFELLSGKKAFPYKTSANQSKQVKRLLTEAATPKNIEIIGG
jgi:hypothetical protein